MRGCLGMFSSTGIEGERADWSRTVINSEHGGCVIIPREDGYIR